MKEGRNEVKEGGREGRKEVKEGRNVVKEGSEGRKIDGTKDNVFDRTGCETSSKEEKKGCTK